MLTILDMQCHARTCPLQLHPHSEFLTEIKVVSMLFVRPHVQNFEFLWSPWVHLACNYEAQWCNSHML
jgi:hypothetical protein